MEKMPHDIMWTHKQLLSHEIRDGVARLVVNDRINFMTLILGAEWQRTAGFDLRRNSHETV